jgi:hypothetical protein
MNSEMMRIYTILTIPYTIHHTPYTIHPAPYTLHYTLYTHTLLEVGNGATALHAAVENGRIETVRVLLDFGVKQSG